MTDDQKLCECCGVQLCDVRVSVEIPEGQGWTVYREACVCDDCYIEVFDRAGAPGAGVQ